MLSDVEGAISRTVTEDCSRRAGFPAAVELKLKEKGGGENREHSATTGRNTFVSVSGRFSAMNRSNYLLLNQ
jgi:hypothetical protein